VNQSWQQTSLCNDMLTTTLLRTYLQTLQTYLHDYFLKAITFKCSICAVWKHKYYH